MGTADAGATAPRSRSAFLVFAACFLIEDAPHNLQHAVMQHIPVRHRGQRRACTPSRQSADAVLPRSSKLPLHNGVFVQPPGLQQSRRGPVAGEGPSLPPYTQAEYAAWGPSSTEASEFSLGESGEEPFLLEAGHAGVYGLPVSRRLNLDAKSLLAASRAATEGENREEEEEDLDNLSALQVSDQPKEDGGEAQSSSDSASNAEGKESAAEDERQAEEGSSQTSTESSEGSASEGQSSGEAKEGTAEGESQQSQQAAEASSEAQEASSPATEASSEAQEASSPAKEDASEKEKEEASSGGGEGSEAEGAPGEQAAASASEAAKSSESKEEAEEEEEEEAEESGSKTEAARSSPPTEEAAAEKQSAGSSSEGSSGAQSAGKEEEQEGGAAPSAEEKKKQSAEAPEGGESASAGEKEEGEAEEEGSKSEEKQAQSAKAEGAAPEGGGAPSASAAESAADAGSAAAPSTGSAEEAAEKPEGGGSTAEAAPSSSGASSQGEQQPAAAAAAAAAAASKGPPPNEAQGAPQPSSGEGAGGPASEAAAMPEEESRPEGVEGAAKTPAAEGENKCYLDIAQEALQAAEELSTNVSRNVHFREADQGFCDEIFRRIDGPYSLGELSALLRAADVADSLQRNFRYCRATATSSPPRVRDGDTVLHAAIAARKPHVAEVLLQYGAFTELPSLRECSVCVAASVVCAQNANPRPIHVAAALEGLDSIEVVEMLLQYGASADSRDSLGRTALMVAAYHPKPQSHEFSKKLLLSKADVKATDKAGLTALHYAAASDNWQVVRLLLDHGADPAAADVRGNTPLHYGAAYNAYQSTSRLLEKGSDSVNINAQNATGKAPLHLAAAPAAFMAAPPAIVPALALEALLLHHANPMARDAQGNNPLHLAARGGYVEILRRLVSLTSIPAEEKNAAGQTPLAAAREALQGPALSEVEHFLEAYADKKSCIEPPSVRHSTRIFSDTVLGPYMRVGDTVTYTCNPGFELFGHATVICQERDGKMEFVPDPPLCVQPSVASAASSPAASGDFLLAAAVSMLLIVCS
ncbi:hypothetical protein Efla_005494 [Eimeria flavescens]